MGNIACAAGGKEARPIPAIDDTWLTRGDDHEPQGCVPPCTGAALRLLRLLHLLHLLCLLHLLHLLCLLHLLA